MEDNSEFNQVLQEKVKAKQTWFNETQMTEMVNTYRLLYTCVKNLYDFLSKKSLISPDPYRLDKRISQIVIPPTDAFPDSDAPKILGERFSDYETMLDFICTYYRFSVDAVTIPEIKKLLEFNSCFDWKDFTTNSQKSNTHALATILNNSKNNAPSVTVSMINDCIAKNCQCVERLNSMLNELGVFQRELFKAELRKDLFEHPDFNKEKAFSSPDAELSEIKRLYSKVVGKKTFYTDLVNEIIEEDQGANKEKARAATLKKLDIRGKTVQEVRKKAGPSSFQMILETAYALGGLAPTLSQLYQKLSENVNTLFAAKKGFFAALGRLFRQAFKLKPKEKIMNVKVVEAKTGVIRQEKVNASEIVQSLGQKTRIYNGIAAKGLEWQKIENSPEESVLTFINHQISECQSLYTFINAMDAYFKTETDILIRAKFKGLQIELSSLRNSLININKKRSDYVSFVEEAMQMEKLGLSNV